MKQKKEPQLPIIDYQGTEFAAHSFDALKKYGAFILKNVHEISTQVPSLLSEFDDFTYLPEERLNSFSAGSGIYDLEGFHAHQQHWAGRRFSSCYGWVRDGAGKVSQSFPSENFHNAAVKFLGVAHEISDKILAAIGEGFNFNSEWAQYFQDYTMLGIADNYVPPTQEKIKDLGDLLILSEDNRLEAFDPHSDVNPLTIIAYEDNNCRGFEIELPNESGDLAYEPLVLPKVSSSHLTLLVLVGSPIESLTGGELRAPRHRVILEPIQPQEIFARRLASAFTLFGSKSKQPKSLLRQETAPVESQEKEFSPEGYIKSKYEPIEKERKEKAKVIPQGFLESFPREEELQRLNLPGYNTSYIRR